MGKTGAVSKNNPGKKGRDAIIAQMALEHKSQSQISKALGLSTSQISRLLNHDDDIKALIDYGARMQVAMIPIAVARQADIVQSGDNTEALQAIKMVLQNTGIAPSHTQSKFVQNVYVQQNNILDPQITSIFKRYFAPSAGTNDADDKQIIEAETL